MFSAHLFLGTLRLWRTASLWWPLGLFLYLMVTGWLVSITAKVFPIEQFLESMPPLMTQVFIGGGVFEAARTQSGRFLVYIDSNFFGTGPIYAALYALFLAPALAMREWDRGTLDTLLARPLSRGSYLLTRYVAFATVSTLVGVGILVSHAIAIGPIAGHAIPWRGLVVATVAWCLVALAFGAIGFLAAVARLSPGVGMATTFALLLVMFTLNLVGLAWEWAEPLANLSFFKWWKPLELLLEQRIDLAPLALYAAVALLAVAAATLLFERRDLA